MREELEWTWGSAADAAAEPPPPARPAIPERVGRYPVEGELGRGAFGSVLAAWDPALRRPVAIKLLHRIADPEARARFEREARVLAGLRAPGLVAVHEAGATPDGRPYLVMDQVAGRSLRLAAPLSPARAAEVVRDAAGAVAAAHRAGVLHRDVKPDNVLVDGDGRGLVVDFGLAFEADAARLSRTGALVGTPAYMAPEQAAGADVDPQVDVWGLGATLYFALTGRSPSEGLTLSELASALASRPPAPPSAHAEVPPALDAIVVRCLSLDRAGRYPSAAALASALDAFAEARAPARRPPARRRRRRRRGLGLDGWAADWRRAAATDPEGFEDEVEKLPHLAEKIRRAVAR